jgi:hypothetical protein
LGQHGPGARRSPAAYRRGSGTCGPGGRRLPAWSRRAPDPYPPRGQGPCAGAIPGPAGWPARESAKFPGGGLHGGRPGGQYVTGRRTSGRPRRRVLRPPGRPPGAGCVPGQRRPGTPSGSGRWRSGPCCRVGRMVFAARPLHILAGSRGTGPGSRRAARTRGRCAVRPVRGHCPGCVITYRAYYQRPGAPAHPLLLRSLARAGDTGSAPGPAPWSPSPSRPAN